MDTSGFSYLTSKTWEKVNFQCGTIGLHYGENKTDMIIWSSTGVWGAACHFDTLVTEGCRCSELTGTSSVPLLTPAMAGKATSPLRPGLPCWRKTGPRFLTAPTAQVGPFTERCGTRLTRGEVRRTLKSDSTSIPTLREMWYKNQETSLLPGLLTYSLTLDKRASISESAFQMKNCLSTFFPNSSGPQRGRNNKCRTMLSSLDERH